MIILLLTISPTNTCDIYYLRCSPVDITWLRSSDRISVMHYVQADKQLYDAIRSNDVPAVRKCLDLGTHVDLAYVRYQTILSHPPILLWLPHCPSKPSLSVFLLFFRSFALFLVDCPSIKPNPCASRPSSFLAPLLSLCVCRRLYFFHRSLPFDLLRPSIILSFPQFFLVYEDFSIHLFYFLFIFLTKFFPFLTKAVMIVIIVMFIIKAILFITITNIIIITAQLRMISIIIANLS